MAPVSHIEPNQQLHDLVEELRQAVNTMSQDVLQVTQRLDNAKWNINFGLGMLAIIAAISIGTLGFGWTNSSRIDGVKDDTSEIRITLANIENDVTNLSQQLEVITTNDIGSIRLQLEDMGRKLDDLIRQGAVGTVGPVFVSIHDPSMPMQAFLRWQGQEICGGAGLLDRYSAACVDYFAKIEAGSPTAVSASEAFSELLFEAYYAKPEAAFWGATGIEGKADDPAVRGEIEAYATTMTQALAEAGFVASGQGVMALVFVAGGAGDNAELSSRIEASGASVDVRWLPLENYGQLAEFFGEELLHDHSAIEASRLPQTSAMMVDERSRLFGFDSLIEVVERIEADNR